jgi:hypothetical protein
MCAPVLAVGDGAFGFPCLPLTLNHQRHGRVGMSDAGLTVPGMTELPRRYDVTVTVDRDSGHLPNPAEFAAAAEQAASARSASAPSPELPGHEDEQS